MSPPVSTSAPRDPLPSIGRRRRAARACRMCKARKVRCDGQIRKNSCTNCQLDGYTCLVDERRTRRQGAQKSNLVPRPDEQEEASEAALPLLQEDVLDMGTDLGHANPRNDNTPGDSMRSCNTLNPQDEIVMCPAALSTVADMDSLTWEALVDGHTLEQLRLPLPPAALADRDPEDLNGQLFSLDDAMMDADDPLRANRAIQLVRPNTSPLSVNLGRRSHLSQKEIDFLESEASFDLPDPPELDHFVRAFFLIVHPNLPIVDEERFWQAYKARDQAVGLSLFVLNAMLCLSSGCIPLEIIQKAGYQGPRQASTTFYRRAKLLFDFGVEDDQIQVANGALLLSYYTASSKSPQIVRNTSWLNTAIEYAKNSKAGHAFEGSESPGRQKRETLRLSWCCFVRDRFLSVGTHRPFKIHNVPDLHSLRTQVFEGDHGPNSVYDHDTSTLLTNLFIVQCRLAVALTGVASEVCTPGVLPAGEQEARASLERIEGLRASLQQWFDESVVQFPTPSVMFISERNVTLSVNVMYFRYYSAKIALAHREALLMHYMMLDEEAFRRCLCNIEDCVGSMRELVKELLLMDLARCLSFGSMLYTIFPFILHWLDVKLASSAAQKAQREGRLKLFMELIDLMRERYSGSDGVDNVVQLLQDQIESEPSLLHLSTQGPDSHNDQPRPAQAIRAKPMNASPWSLARPCPLANLEVGWQDVLIYRRRLYFQLVLSLEVSLSQGFAAHADDILPLLQPLQFTDSIREDS
ncbi:hypothetical protein BHE90_015954 [Fusarium euwallaceae]|uniref:Zn(2)-C6 fungal-type domain-containing protein n=1 Tax=Fusarium euwallaceae TaxID=1147111 RepID=A0A430L1V0_9HYPO|nr:hypothetical protein BHE90_015954 [Fusarium euwallaceae]